MSVLESGRAARGQSDTPAVEEYRPPRSKGFWSSLRFRMSMLATAVMNLGPLGLAARGVCTPGFNCHGCPAASFACPVGVVAYGSAIRSFPALAIATVLAVAAAVGRAVCAFGCPFGLLQELLYRLPTRKMRLPEWTRYGKYAALALLVVGFPFLLGFRPEGYIVLDPPTAEAVGPGEVEIGLSISNHGDTVLRDPEFTLAYIDRESGGEAWTRACVLEGVVLEPGETHECPPVAAPDLRATADLQVTSPQAIARPAPRYNLYFCKVCPNGTLTATIPAIASGARTGGMYGWSGSTWVRLGILGGVLVLMVVSSRGFCRTLCPLGAFYALGSRLAIWRVAIDHSACTNCGACNRVCPVEIDVATQAGGPECIACGECIKSCPRSGVGRKFGL